MRTVNIAELKNRLSTYITYAKAGETIIIRDRNTPVAQLIPLPLEEGITEEDRDLVAAGILRLPKKPWDPSAFLAMPIPKVEGNAGTQAILDDRNEGL
jgi:prevent-host-death family protein